MKLVEIIDSSITTDIQATLISLKSRGVKKIKKDTFVEFLRKNNVDVASEDIGGIVMSFPSVSDVDSDYIYLVDKSETEPKEVDNSDSEKVESLAKKEVNKAMKEG